MQQTTPHLIIALFLLIISFLTSCGDDATPASDGDWDSLEAEGEDLLSCDFADSVCDDGQVLSCVDGQKQWRDCETNRYCNYGECIETSVSFPDDASYHAERSEWWYYTGHLKNEDRRWGFEVTIFQYDMSAIYDISGYGYMCHVAVTDSVAGEHYHIDSISLSPETWKQNPTVLEVDQCRFELDGEGKDHIVATIPQDMEKDGKASPWEIDLSFVPQKRAALHGGDGIIPMSDSGGTSWYYSFTDLQADGQLSTPDGKFAVSGQAWMDHQWGQFDIVDFKGWDWWSMQFDDGWQIMLFQFTDWDGQLAVQAGSLIDPDGNTTELEGLDDFSITSIRTWESPHTDGVYPLDWNISIPEMDWQLQVRVAIDDQEMYNPAQNYWEGETSITGTRSGEAVLGVGYTELTGYATDILDPKVKR